MRRDVLIAGGGVIGLMTARQLKKAGVDKIAVVEKGVCGEEASWAAAGMLGPQAEANEASPFLDICMQSRELFPQLAAELLDETGIDIELDRAGTLYLSFSESDSRVLDTRFAWQSAAGLPVKRLTANDIRKAEPFVSPDVREALFFADDWQVENRKLLAALRRYAELNDIELIENTNADSVIVEGKQSCGIVVGNDEMLSQHVVLATGAWSSLVKLGAKSLPVKVDPVRGQILAFRTAKRLFEHVVVTPRGYIVPRADGRILAGSTREHVGFDKGTTDEAAQHLTQMTFEIAPSLAGQKPHDQWSGLRSNAADGLPVLGPVSGIDGLTIATAHYRNGILLAPLTANVVAQRIVNGTDSWTFAAFGADRFALKASGSN